MFYKIKDYININQLCSRNCVIHLILYIFVLIMILTKIGCNTVPTKKTRRQYDIF